MTLTTILTIVVLHFLFDWFQPRRIQNRKWKSFTTLSIHTFISTAPFMLYLCTFNVEVGLLVWYSLLLFGTHFILDCITSNIAQLCKMAESEYGLIVVTAIDQMIHFFIYFYLFYSII